MGDFGGWGPLVFLVFVSVASIALELYNGHGAWISFLGVVYCGYRILKELRR